MVRQVVAAVVFLCCCISLPAQGEKRTQPVSSPPHRLHKTSKGPVRSRMQRRPRSNEINATDDVSPRLGRKSKRNGKISLRLDPWVPWVVGINAGIAWFSLEMIKKRVGPESCRWCDGASSRPPNIDPVDESFRKALRWQDTETADIISTVLAFGLAPSWALGSILLLRKDSWSNRLVDLSLIYESAALASAMAQATAMAVARRRPEARFNRVAADKGFENTSFPSGHTTFAFSLAAATTALFWIRNTRWTWLVATVGFAVAVGTGLMRVAADRHYITDVLAGATVGTAVGILTPRLSLRW